MKWILLLLALILIPASLADTQYANISTSRTFNLLIQNDTIEVQSDCGTFFFNNTMGIGQFQCNSTLQVPIAIINITVQNITNNLYNTTYINGSNWTYNYTINNTYTYQADMSKVVCQVNSTNVTNVYNNNQNCDLSPVISKIDTIKPQPSTISAQAIFQDNTTNTSSTISGNENLQVIVIVVIIMVFLALLGMAAYMIVRRNSKPKPSTLNPPRAPETSMDERFASQ